MTFAQLGRALGTAVAVATLAVAVSSPASAHGLWKRHGHAYPGTHALVKAGYSDSRGWYRSRVRPVRVDAPFATVETRRGTSTAVDAPFASVRTHRRYGTWVRAPFVNLHIPR